MTEIHRIQRRPDGSIDTKLYLDKGLNHRSMIAQKMAGQATIRFHKRLAWLLTITTFPTYRGDHTFKNSAGDIEP